MIVMWFFSVEAQIAGDALETLDGVESLLQSAGFGGLRRLDHMREHHDAVVARFGEGGRFDIEALLVFLAERRQLGTRVQIGRQRRADRAVGEVAGELGEGVVGVGLIIAENGRGVADRMQVLQESRLILRRQPDVDAFDARRPWLR